MEFNENVLKNLKIKIKKYIFFNNDLTEFFHNQKEAGIYKTF